MNALTKRVLAKILRDLASPSVPGSTFSFAEGHRQEPDLIPGTRNTDLIRDPAFKAGYQRCYDQFVEYLALLDSPRKDQEKYAGRIPRRTS